MVARVIRTTLTLVLIAALIGCDRYELKEDKHGRTIKLDKRTGNTWILKGSKWVKTGSGDKDSEQKVKSNLALSLGEPRDWPTVDLSQLGVDSVTLTTMWEDGMVRCRLIIKPVPENFGIAKGSDVASAIRAGYPFTLYFYDANGFEVLSVIVARRFIRRTVDRDGRDVGLVANPIGYCGNETYADLASWSISWSF